MSSSVRSLIDMHKHARLFQKPTTCNIFVACNVQVSKYKYVHRHKYILNIQNLSKSIQVVTSIDFVPFDFAPPACSVDALEAPGKEGSEEPFHGVLVVLSGRHKSYHEYHDTLWAISSALCKMRNKRTKKN